MSTTIRRRGAPLGNQNARKHGFYSRHSRLAELPLQEPGDDLDQQIAVIRHYMQRVSELGEESQDLPQLISLLRGVCMASSRLDQLQRRQATQAAFKVNKDELEKIIQSVKVDMEPNE